MGRARNSYKDPLVAGILAVIPGAGHFYCGERLRGVSYMLGTAVGLFLFVVPGLFLWAASIPDVVLCARRRNRMMPPLRHMSMVNITDGPDPVSPPLQPAEPVEETPPDPWTESAR
ncbi:MAG: hypothetical protein O7F11_09235 [Acidobacteria bacterium]|nr:hypothetical protein [Acidobacteriota bacterium]